MPYPGAKASLVRIGVSVVPCFSHDFGMGQASRNKGLQSEQANVVDLFA